MLVSSQCSLATLTAHNQEGFASIAVAMRSARSRGYRFPVDCIFLPAISGRESDLAAAIQIRFTVSIEITGDTSRDRRFCSPPGVGPPFQNSDCHPLPVDIATFQLPALPVQHAKSVFRLH